MGSDERTILRAQVWGTKGEEYPVLLLGVLTGVPKGLDNLVLLWGLMGGEPKFCPGGEKPGSAFGDSI